MKRAIVLFALAGLVGCGGGSTTPPDASTAAQLDASTATELKIEDVFPANNAVAGWTVELDDEQQPKKIEVYKTAAEVDTSPIDGDVIAFQNVGFTAAARQFYTNGTYTIELRVWQMKDAAGATQVYTKVLSDPPSTYYAAIQWTDQALGSGSRYGFNRPQWLIDTYKGAYFVEARVRPSTINDAAGHTSANPVLQYVLDKIK